MNILLNNKPEKIFDGSTVKKLLEIKNIKNKYYAVEINKRIIAAQNTAIPGLRLNIKEFESFY